MPGPCGQRRDRRGVRPAQIGGAEIRGARPSTNRVSTGFWPADWPVGTFGSPTTSPRRWTRSDIVFVCVGTPPGPDGHPEMGAIRSVARSIAENLHHYHVIVTKSTVPIGTGYWMGSLIEDIVGLEGRGLYGMVSNPEFLREGNAVQDYLHPDRVVLGSDDERALRIAADVYRPILEQKIPGEVGNWEVVPLLQTRLTTAEMIKYASNAFLATKISFANEISRISDFVGADVTEVTAGMGLDVRISERFLDAGLGWGGSCFGKDLSALVSTAGEYGYEPKLLEAAISVNEAQRQLVIDELLRDLRTLRGARICLLGLAFKPDTDDLRDSPALDIACRLVSKGAIGHGLRPHGHLGAGRPRHPDPARSVRGRGRGRRHRGGHGVAPVPRPSTSPCCGRGRGETCFWTVGTTSIRNRCSGPDSATWASVAAPPSPRPAPGPLPRRRRTTEWCHGDRVPRISDGGLDPWQRELSSSPEGPGSSAATPASTCWRTITRSWWWTTSPTARPGCWTRWRGCRVASSPTTSWTCAIGPRSNRCSPPTTSVRSSTSRPERPLASRWSSPSSTTAPISSPPSTSCGACRSTASRTWCSRRRAPSTATPRSSRSTSRRLRARPIPMPAPSSCARRCWPTPASAIPGGPYWPSATSIRPAPTRAVTWARTRGASRTTSCPTSPRWRSGVCPARGLRRRLPDPGRIGGAGLRPRHGSGRRPPGGPRAPRRAPGVRQLQHRYRCRHVGAGAGLAVREGQWCRDSPQVVDRRPGDVAELVASPRLAEAELGWTARRDVEAMCRDAWAFQSKHPQGIT